MNISDHPLGTLIETDSFVLLFGNRDSQIESLKTNFPEIRFKRIKQVHGPKLVHSSPHSIDFSAEADAHYSNETHLGLCISTADCIPIMITSTKPRWVASIHAGWRGIENRIFQNTAKSLIRLGCNPRTLLVFVGPHIQTTSFEVQNEVRDLLLKSADTWDTNHCWTAISEDKSLVNLNEILKSQIEACQIPLENVFFEYKDTVKDPTYHSYRRDKDQSGRQLSFISLK
ncbi:MAG: hypothetical protein COT73_07775 [Bdellovibrio sp. CG10_big_fil_rev_8_21_14_0_10_47_8]|nr:MAG: hypothetical protein COT73_07775 [Bdellovibrio sp. CG10_big_fil_rev_8_21_14_0_10_47_8]